MNFESQADDLQFYPTPAWLARKAWDTFVNTDFKRVIDACAGTGALAMAAPWIERQKRWGEKPNLQGIECVEIDVSKHPVLRGHGLSVVGLDFLKYQGSPGASHIIMNPPFRNAEQFVLKAYDLLWEGEIVAIIGAHTLRNLRGQDRQRLAMLVEKHGSCEFIQDAFKGPDVEREADVEVALVHLVKRRQDNVAWIDALIGSLATDSQAERQFEQLQQDWDLCGQLALPKGFISTQVDAFRLAVKAMWEAVRYEAVAEHLANRVGQTMQEVTHSRSEDPPARKMLKKPASMPLGEGMRASVDARYMALKDRAWSSVLHSTEALNRLSANVKKAAEHQFEAIKLLDFTEENIYAFFQGLIEQQPEMLLDAACDVFDTITGYGTDNTCYFKGWASNDLHLTCGRRIKTTRFIIPKHKRESSSRAMTYESMQQLADFDRVFAFVDGKTEPATSLQHVFEKYYDELYQGARLTSSYFDVRFYPTIGTIHFFPRSKELIDRFNRIVGQRRQWLPPRTEAAPEQFWEQYEKAESFDRELQEEVKAVRKKQLGHSYSARFDDPYRSISRAAGGQHLDGDDTRSIRAVEQALVNVLERHGLHAALTCTRGATPATAEVLAIQHDPSAPAPDLRKAA